MIVDAGEDEHVEHQEEAADANGDAQSRGVAVIMAGGEFLQEFLFFLVIGDYDVEVVLFVGGGVGDALCALGTGEVGIGHWGGIQRGRQSREGFGSDGSYKW